MKTKRRLRSLRSLDLVRGILSLWNICERVDILSPHPGPLPLEGRGRSPRRRRQKSAHRFSTRLGVLSLLSCLLFVPTPGRTASAIGGVDVILWFDTEDYLLPADDDACKRLAEMLSERKIRATFKVVGEKARVLDKRGRHDVIRALKKHDIGYHANFHSVHPAPSEYLAECGWLDGVAEFARREGWGAADVRRVFSVKTLVCYGQPGSSWAPQAIGALREIGVAPQGVPCYVDEGTHVGLDEKPFWYAGALNVYHMGQNYTRMDLHDPAAVEPANKKVSAIADRLRAGGGGLISIFYHPCEWVHKEFWDGVNFRRGANPPREEWKPPPQRTPEETEGAFRRFGEYIDHIRSIPGIRFITAGDLPIIYPDLTRTKGGGEQDFAQITARVSGSSSQGLDFQVVGNQAYSLADQFELLTVVVGDLIDGKETRFPLRLDGLLGPEAAASSMPALEGRVKWPAFRDAVLDVRNFISTQHRVPSRIFIGADAVGPAEFLMALGSVCEDQNRVARLPLEEGVSLRDAPAILPAQRIAKDSPGLFGGWIIHKEGFRAPKILEMARLQAWTLKPAIRSER